MSDQNKKPEEKTEAEINTAIDVDLETAADDAFGSDIEISAQAAAEVEGETRSAEEIATAAEEKKAAEDLAKENEGKSPEEIAEAEEKKAAEALAKENEGKSAEEIATAAEEKAAEDKAAEEEEPYAIPDELKGRTRERFEKLTTSLKAVNEKAEKQEGIIKGFQGILEKTGLNPTELQRTLDLGALMKIDPSRALETLTAVVADLSTQLGVVAPGGDALEGQDDLKQKVADRELSLEDATEIAKARVKSAAEKKQAELGAQQRTAAQKTEHQQGVDADAFKTQVETAQGQVAEFLASVQTDPDYEKIAPRLVGVAKFAAENLAPEKWLGYIKNEHKNIKEIASAANPGGGATPIMDSAPPGGEKTAQNLEQLADQML